MAVLTPAAVFPPGMKPKKAEIIQLLDQIQGTGSNPAVVKQTKAALDAVTPVSENYGGLVLNDPDPTKNGYYYRDAAAWVKGRGFPDTFAVLTSVGGTANAITAATEAGVNPADVLCVLLPGPPGTNSSGTVTLALNGGPAVPVRAASGSNLAAGDIIEGVGTLLFRVGSEWRQLFSSATGATFDHQGDWNSGTTYTEDQIVTGSNGNWYQLKVPSSLNDDPVSGGSGDWLMVLASAALPDGSVTEPKLAAALKGKLVAFASDRAELSALDGDTYQAVDLMEPGRKGLFVWDGSDLSAEVSADTEQGIYVAPAGDATGASGAWVRQFDGPYLSTWFGAHPDNSDNTAIYDALIATVPAGATIRWPEIDGAWAGSFVSTKPFTLELGRNTFQEQPFSQESGDAVFHFGGSHTQITTLTANVQYGQNVLTMASTAALTAGDIIIIEDDTARPTDSALVNQELLRVREVIDSTTVSVDDFCRSYQEEGTRRVFKVTPIVGVRVYGGHVRIDRPWDGTVGHYGEAISVYHGDDARLIDNEVSNHAGSSVRLRMCIDSLVSGAHVHDGPRRAASGGSYGPQAYIGRNIHFEKIRSRFTRNIADFHAVYNGKLVDVHGYDSNSIGIMHNGFGGNILVERADITVFGSNYGISTNRQGRTDSATKMIARDVTIRDINFRTDRRPNPGQGTFIGIYLQQSWANLLIENVRLMPGSGSTTPSGNQLCTGIRLNGYPAGPTLIRNITQESVSNLPDTYYGVDFLVYIVGDAGGLTVQHWPVVVENCHAYWCNGIVRAAGVKHLLTTNLTAVVIAGGGGVKDIYTNNSITNVTNQSLGVHAVVS